MSSKSSCPWKMSRAWPLRLDVNIRMKALWYIWTKYLQILYNCPHALNCPVIVSDCCAWRLDLPKSFTKKKKKKSTKLLNPKSGVCKQIFIKRVCRHFMKCFMSIRKKNFSWNKHINWTFVFLSGRLSHHTYVQAFNEWTVGQERHFFHFIFEYIGGNCGLEWTFVQEYNTC